MMAMALTPQQEAAYALDYGVDRSKLRPEIQAEYDRLVGEGYLEERWRPRTKEERKEERKEARQERSKEKRHKAEERRDLAARTTWFPGLGVAVRDGNVYQHGADRDGSFSDLQAMSERNMGREMKLVGPLAGAHAEVGGGQAGRRRSGGKIATDTAFNTLTLGPIGLLSALSRKGFEMFAVVSFADGTIYEKKFEKKNTDASSLIKAQAEAVRFNAVAAASQPIDSAGSGFAEGSAQGDTGVAGELERLAALHASGALDSEEFRAAKARIIGS
jgi:hypothetical protein